jgi:mRNA interferase MazF
MTTKGRAYPSRVSVTFQKQSGQIILDQIRTVDKSRLIRRLGSIDQQTAEEVLQVLQQMFTL